MADFGVAYQKLALVEGLYSNDRDDPAARLSAALLVITGQWPGWLAVDAAKRRAGFPANLKADKLLSAAVQNFYRQNFWAVFWLGRFRPGPGGGNF